MLHTCKYLHITYQDQKTNKRLRIIVKVVMEKSQDFPPTDRNKSKIEELPDEELIEYMYQHVQFDEMPFETDKLYDHHQIYTHDTAHIKYGLYENIEVTAAFEMYLHKTDMMEQTEEKIWHTCTIWFDPCLKHMILVHKQ